MIHYSAHLTFRLNLRKIPRALPKTIYLRAKRRYFDVATDTFAAVMSVTFNKKRRNMMVVYRKGNGGILIITIHPLKRNQLQNRVASGRWQRVMRGGK